MSKIYSPEVSAKILDAITAVSMGNNGYADIGNSAEVAEAVTDAGFTVIATSNLHGCPVFRGFTKAAQTALSSEPYGVSTYKPIVHKPEDVDYEGLILARDERMNEGF